MDRITFPNGKTYVTHDALTCGDYGGAGSVGAANIRCVLEQFEGRIEDWGYSELHDESEGRASQLVRVPGDSGYPQDYRHEWQHRTSDPEAVCLHVHGGYGSEWIYLLEGNEGCDEILAGLEDYPLIDEEVHSEVEMEWEDEAWKSWLRSDLIKTLPVDNDEDEPPTFGEWIDDLVDRNDEVLWGAYRAAMEETNTYPTPEQAGVHVDVDRIAGAFEKHLLRLREAQLDGPDAARQIPLPLEVHPR